MDFVTSKNADGSDLKIAYGDYGKGKPVILIHGWPLSKEMWEYQIDALVENGCRVIAYDRRGFGKSDVPWEGYDYDALTDDLHAIISQLSLNDVTLVGFSMGGGEVVRYFSKHGGAQVTKVILIASVTPYMLQTDTNPDGVPQEVFDDIAQKIKDDRIAFLDDFGKTFFGVGVLNKPISTPLLEYYRTLAALASPRSTMQCALSYSTTDFRKEMSMVKVPALVIHGSADKTVPVKATSEEAVKVIPGSELIIYKGAPHGLWYTHRNRLNADLVAFVTGKGLLSNHQNSAYYNEGPTL